MRSRFTLIELLVVVAIIVGLTAPLMPSLQKAPLLAKAAKCSSNQRQVGLAAALYSDVYGEWVPVCNTDPNFVWWHENLYPCARSVDVFQCPAVNQPWNGAMMSDPARPKGNGSYGVMYQTALNVDLVMSDGTINHNANTTRSLAWPLAPFRRVQGRAKSRLIFPAISHAVPRQFLMLPATLHAVPSRSERGSQGPAMSIQCGGAASIQSMSST